MKGRGANALVNPVNVTWGITLCTYRM